jgi:hypothetical protein
MPQETVRKVAKRNSANRKTVAKKSPASRPTAKRTKAEPPILPVRREPTDEEIRFRAYLIAEQRMKQGLSGSEADDWFEAVRQLQEEERDAAS